MALAFLSSGSQLLWFGPLNCIKDPIIDLAWSPYQFHLHLIWNQGSSFIAGRRPQEMQKLFAFWLPVIYTSLRRAIENGNFLLSHKIYDSKERIHINSAAPGKSYFKKPNWVSLRLEFIQTDTIILKANRLRPRNYLHWEQRYNYFSDVSITFRL